MKSILKLLLGLIAGAVGGAIINMGLIIVGSAIVPAPPGIDVTDPASLSAAAGLLEPQHFIFPFLAHAGGTLAGCLIACLIVVERRRLASIIIGCFFLLGGIVNAFMIPAPAWFIVMDLGLAYIPMALLAVWIHQRLQVNTRSSE